MNHVFEDIEVKENAITLLEQALRRKRQRCMIGTGGMSDPYIPLELELGYTRRVLELIEQYGFGVTVHTKSDRVLRDVDLLQKIHSKTKCVVQMTLTTYDEALCKIIEPNVCSTKARVEALKKLKDVGIPTVVWLCPILPFINDTVENITGILEYCREAGVYGIINYGMGVTLRDGDREYFYKQLERHFPGMKAKYIQQYGNQYELPSLRNTELMKLFHAKCREYGIMHDNREIFRYLHAFEDKEAGEQLSLWE